MANIKQYSKALYYYTKAALIYRNLRRYLKKDFAKDLQFPDELKRNYFYNSPFYNRTKQYMHANHFFGELLCLLRAQPISAMERMRFANLSSCAPLFDDFFEKENDLSHILQLLHYPMIESAENDEEKLSVIFLNNIIESMSDKQKFMDAAQQLFQAQKESKKQTDSNLSISELLNISKRKGGYSGLMYAHLLDKPKDELFFEMAYHLGSLGQLMDDIFDIYDDAKEGLRTFANQSQNTSEISLIIQEQIKLIHTLLGSMDEKLFTKADFSAVLAIFVSTIELAIHHYKSIEQDLGISPNNCLQSERKIWIVDMENPINILRLFNRSAHKL